jgi:hypothetical protein
MGTMSESKARAILAANLRRKIEADQKGSRFSVRAWAMGKDLDVRLIDRLVKGQHAVQLDNIEKVAQACGLQPWHLLLEDMPVDGPAEAPVTEAERAMIRRLRKILGDDPANAGL